MWRGPAPGGREGRTFLWAPTAPLCRRRKRSAAIGTRARDRGCSSAWDRWMADACARAWRRFRSRPRREQLLEVRKRCVRIPQRLQSSLGAGYPGGWPKAGRGLCPPLARGGEREPPKPGVPFAPCVSSLALSPRRWKRGGGSELAGRSRWSRFLCRSSAVEPCERTLFETWRN